MNRRPVYKIYGTNNPSINTNTFVAPNAAVIGDVRISSGSSIWYGTVLRGDSNYISIGSGCSIGDNCVVHVASNNNLRETPNPTTIGDNVVVGMY